MISSVRGVVGGSFDEFAVVEGRTGTDKGNEVRCVYSPPTDLGGFDELERDGQAGRPGSGTLGDLAPVSDGLEA